MTRKAGRRQRGVLIVALMAGIAIAMILSTVAAQKWSDVVRRDAEAEMMFRAQDISRAIKRFQLDRGRLPNELKELLEVGAHRPQYFIRQLWKDPLVKGGQWQLVYAAPGGGIFDPTAPLPGAPGGPPAPGAPGASTPLGSIFQTQPGQPPTPPGQNDPGGMPQIGRNPDGTPDVSGLPIAGVKTKCTDRPFRKYKDKDQYSEWLFTIFDLEPRNTPGQPGTPAAPGAPGTPATPKTGASFPPK